MAVHGGKKKTLTGSRCGTHDALRILQQSLHTTLTCTLRWGAIIWYLGRRPSGGGFHFPLHNNSARIFCILYVVAKVTAGNGEKSPFNVLRRYVAQNNKNKIVGGGGPEK